MDSKDFFNNYWEKKDQRLVFRHQAALDFVERGPVLDLGCGDGFFLQKLRERSISGVGLDLSEEAVRKARGKGLQAELFDFSQNPLPYRDNSFEQVTLLDVLGYFYNPGFLLKEVRRVVKKEIIISACNFNSLPARAQMLMGKIPENNAPKRGHIFWLSWPVITSLLKENQLEIVEVKTNSFFSWVPGLKNVMEFLAKLRPSIFALNFVIKARKIY